MFVLSKMRILEKDNYICGTSLSHCKPAGERPHWGGQARAGTKGGSVVLEKQGDTGTDNQHYLSGKI